MIEVLFGESEAASMKVAKSTDIHLKTKGSTFGAECGTEGNSTQQVICLGFMLDIGDIEKEVTSEYRKDLIYSMFYQEQCGRDLDMSRELMEAADVYRKELERLKEYIESGESIRIWYSTSPYSICGLYFVCNLMRQYDNEMYLVELPKYRTNKKTITSYQSWAAVAADEFASFVQYQKKISVYEKKMYAQQWGELVADNSPLRAMINNQVMGVQADFYDFIIWKRLDEKPIKQARLIGDILGCYQIGVGDWWYAKRIQHFIDDGMIEVVENSVEKYARVIRKRRKE